MLLLAALLATPAVAQAARHAGKGRSYVPRPTARLALGLSDQDPMTFTDPLFVPLHIRQARFVIPWDALYTRPGYVDDWVKAAKRARIKPLIAFEHTARDRCPAVCSQPSVAAYTRAFRLFRSRYPWVRQFSPWNEANHQTQPTWKRPKLAAQYYNAVRRFCRGCQIVAADVLDEANMAKWLRSFKRYAKRPNLWGLHNYRDVNRFRTIGTKTLLRTVRGHVWLTETGGISAFTTSKGKVALPYDTQRAARSLRFLFSRLVPLNRRRMTRVYIFNWRPRAAEQFDSGLLGPDGLPRPVYWVLHQLSQAPPAIPPLPPARRSSRR